MPETDVLQWFAIVFFGLAFIFHLLMPDDNDSRR